MTKVKEQGTAEQEATFDKQTIIDAAESFGSTREIIIGALHNKDGPFTRDEVDGFIQDFLSRPIDNE